MKKTKLPPKKINLDVPGDVHFSIMMCAKSEGKNYKDKVVEILTMWSDKQIMNNKQKK